MPVQLYEAEAHDTYRAAVKAIRERYGEPQEGGWMAGELAMAMQWLVNKPDIGSGVIEIGSANGVSFAAWAQAIPNGHHISIDLVDATCTWSGRMTLEQRNRLWAEDVPRHVSILADSASELARASCEAVLGGARVDFLFIDGDHSYEAARRDFELYEKHVRKGGVIAFHDTHHPLHGRNDCGKVFVELAELHGGEAIVTGMGIGFVTKTWEDGCGFIPVVPAVTAGG